MLFKFFGFPLSRALGPAYMVTKNWTKAETETKTEKGPVLKLVISFTPKPSSIRSKGKVRNLGGGNVAIIEN